MNIYLSIAIKTILFLFVVIIILKIMGKRELGQLNTFDIVIFFMISELFSLSIDEPHENVFQTLLPIMIIFVVQILMSIVVLKSNKIRKIIEENPSFIINNGVIDQRKMKKLRYNIDDLCEQVRMQGVDNLKDVEYAVLESNGNLSVIKKGEENSKIPFPLIKDGVIDYISLKIIKKDKEWLINKLKDKGYVDIKQIFICMLDKNDGLYIVEKDYWVSFSSFKFLKMIIANIITKIIKDIAVDKATPIIFILGNKTTNNPILMADVKTS